MGSIFHRQTDLHIYEEIISGKLNPAIQENGELHILQNLIVNSNTRIFYKCGPEEDPKVFVATYDVTELGYQFREDAEILVKEDPLNKGKEICQDHGLIDP
jgi:hypothetical protein